MKHLQKLIQDIKRQSISSSKLPSTNNLKQRLIPLSGLEKEILSKIIYEEIEYDIGTPKILEILHETKILTIKRFLKKIDDVDMILNIYCDFLETRPALFAELIKDLDQHHHYLQNKMQLRNNLIQFLEYYLKDVQKLTKNPFPKVFMSLSPQSCLYLQRNIITTFLKRNLCPITEAIGKQHLWKEDDCNVMEDQILQASLKNLEIFDFIHDFVISDIKDGQLDWKCYCQIIDKLGKRYEKEIIMHYKKLVINDFKKFVHDKNDFLLMFIMITIRQLCISVPDSYLEWYRRLIGEMSYVIKKEEFLYVMKVITKMVQYEGNTEIIQIHLQTRIQAPPLCNDQVMTYKAILRSHLETMDKKVDVILLDDL